MEQKNAKDILSRYQAGTATNDEKAYIESWILHGASGDLDLTDDELLHDLIEIRQRLNLDELKPKTVSLWATPRFAGIAAAILLFLIAGGYYLSQKAEPTQQIVQNQHDIAPGNNKAMLVLANGQQIDLADAKPGMLANQGNTTINKSGEGKVTYKVDKPGIAQINYNTITIPKAGKWMVVLPDGSKAYLDALSSIRFPTEFTYNNRTVEITGQVYFEVIHDAAKPFRVVANGQTVEDIGTRFNINAYKDEPVVRTTLLEGSVKVLKGNKNVILKPGQQSIIANTGNNIRVEGAEDATAWKEGYFSFKKASIQTVMRQFARWYDVDVKYEGQTPTSMITGKVPRDVNASEALKILTYLDIHFKIENKTIIIMR